MGTQQRKRALGTGVVRENFQEEGSKRSIIDYSQASVNTKQRLGEKKILTLLEVRLFND